MTLDYDPRRRVATVGGTTVAMTRRNVLFVDGVDSAAGPRVAGTMQIDRRMPGSAGQIGLVLRKSPRIVSFLRCNARTADGRKQAMLERLCAENLGILP